jgi:hypothetical protein
MTYNITRVKRKDNQEFPPIDAGIPAQPSNGFPIHTLSPLGEGLLPNCTPERVVARMHKLLIE